MVIHFSLMKDREMIFQVLKDNLNLRGWISNGKARNSNVIEQRSFETN